MTVLDQWQQALRANPTPGGCIDFLRHFGAPAMIGPDKGALGAALKVWPRGHLEQHLADALVDWIRVRIKNEKQLSVPQAVRQYLQDRADGVLLEGAKPELSQAQIDAVEALKRMKMPAATAKGYVAAAKSEDEEGIIREALAMNYTELAAKGVRTT